MSSRKDGSQADGDGGNQATMNKIHNTKLESNMTEILGIIEQKGTEIQEALAVLREL